MNDTKTPKEYIKRMKDTAEIYERTLVKYWGQSWWKNTPIHASLSLSMMATHHLMLWCGGVIEERKFFCGWVGDVMVSENVLGEWCC